MQGGRSLPVTSIAATICRMVLRRNLNLAPCARASFFSSASGPGLVQVQVKVQVLVLLLLMLTTNLIYSSNPRPSPSEDEEDARGRGDCRNCRNSTTQRMGRPQWNQNQRRSVERYDSDSDSLPHLAKMQRQRPTIFDTRTRITEADANHTATRHPRPHLFLFLP